MNIGKILKQSLTDKASDVLLSSGSYPSFKVDGDITYLEEYEKYTDEILREELYSIMTASQREKFNEEHELDFSIELKGFSRFRVNCFVQKDGISAVFRPIPTDIPLFENLWLPNQIKEFAHKKGWLVLVTGTVWSGKSTTLASLINEINLTEKKHIITIEDPIEYSYKSALSLIEQREVGEDTHSFENGLKYALRQAPDVILVWEMRDLTTFRLALRAAETGSLVFATLHTSGAARTVARIIDMFPGDEKEIVRQQVSDSLIGVVWQALLKKKWGKWRVAAVEVMMTNKWISNLIRKGLVHQIDSSIEIGRWDGNVPMKDSLDFLLKDGSISQKDYDFLMEDNDDDV
jgi:twitching motility protein PilT